jgi:hypothetical protein
VLISGLTIAGLTQVSTKWARCTVMDIARSALQQGLTWDRSLAFRHGIFETRSVHTLVVYNVHSGSKHCMDLMNIARYLDRLYLEVYPDKAFQNNMSFSGFVLMFVPKHVTWCGLDS